MILIKKSKGQFFVSYCAENGEVLAHSEMFTTKQSAWKNIIALYKLFPQAVEPHYIYVKDMTLKKPQVYLYNMISKKKSKK